MAVFFEGYTADELLALPEAEFDEFVLSEEALAFRVGSAELLGRFSRHGARLIVELAQIDGGGEGVLPALSAVVTRFARHRGLSAVEWQVHAVTCAEPNLKLRRVLERRGFEVRTLEGVGRVYHKVVAVDDGEGVRRRG